MLRYRTPDSELRVKMWLFPVLSIITAVAIVAILVQMGLQSDARSQLVLSLLSWAVVIVVYFANKWFINRRPELEGAPTTDASSPRAGTRKPDSQFPGAARRVATHRRGPRCHLFRGRPSQPDRGLERPPGTVPSTSWKRRARWRSSGLTARWPHFIRRTWMRTERSATIDHCVPSSAVDSFHPDQIVIATLPPEDSVWHRFDVVDRARAEHGVPVTHVVAAAPVAV